MDEPILASAVIVPERSEIRDTSPTSTLKRRQSSVLENGNEIGHRNGNPNEDDGDSRDSKRPRLSPSRLLSASLEGDDATAHRRSNAAIAGTAPTAVAVSARGTGARSTIEERKRGQRLFGSILGTLSQSPASRAGGIRGAGAGAGGPRGQNSEGARHSGVEADFTRGLKRAEIEQKQLDKLKLRREEEEIRRQRKREELLSLRKREQLRWDVEGLIVRHDNLRAVAGFLRTDSEPHLYWKPWELREEEENIIDKQMKETQEIIERERMEFEQRRGKRLEELDREEERLAARKHKKQEDKVSDDEQIGLERQKKREKDRGHWPQDRGERSQSIARSRRGDSTNDKDGRDIAEMLDGDNRAVQSTENSRTKQHERDPSKKQNIPNSCVENEPTNGQHGLKHQERHSQDHDEDRKMSDVGEKPTSSASPERGGKDRSLKRHPAAHVNVHGGNYDEADNKHHPTGQDHDHEHDHDNDHGPEELVEGQEDDVIY